MSEVNSDYWRCDQLVQILIVCSSRNSSIWNRETVTVFVLTVCRSVEHVTRCTLSRYHRADETFSFKLTVCRPLSDWLLDYKKICVNERSDDECVKSLWSVQPRQFLRTHWLHSQTSACFKEYKHFKDSLISSKGRRIKEEPAGFLLQFSSACTWR